MMQQLPMFGKVTTVIAIFWQHFAHSATKRASLIAFVSIGTNRSEYTVSYFIEV